MAKDGQMAVVKTMAKDLVRTRAQVCMSVCLFLINH